MKKFKLAAAATVLSLSMAGMALAGTWRTGAVRTSDWWYDNDDGTWAANGWHWIDGNNDGIAECYYFDADGWMLESTTTPDGYTVNADGAWVLNGAVQTQSAGQQAAAAAQNASSQSAAESTERKEAEPAAAESQPEDSKAASVSASDGDITKAATIAGVFEGAMSDGGTYRMEITANSDGTATVVESNPYGSWTNIYHYASTISAGALWAYETADEKGNMTVVSPDLIDMGWKLNRVK